MKNVDVVGREQKSAPVPTAYCWDRSADTQYSCGATRLARSYLSRPLLTYLHTLRLDNGREIPSIATCAEALSFALISPFAEGALRRRTNRRSLKMQDFRLLLLLSGFIVVIIAPPNRIVKRFFVFSENYK